MAGRAIGLTIFFAAAFALPGPAGAADGDRFGALFGELRAVCANPPAGACADRVVAFLDTDGDGSVERRELEAVRLLARAEMRQPKSGLSNNERGAIALALMALESAGSGAVFSGFDQDGDGRVGRAEIFADFRLDRRPFNAVVADPDAVDWQAFADRFGKSGRLFLPLLTASSSAAR
jgi:hypothetical protein